MGVVGGKRVAGLGVLGEWVGGGRLTAGGGEVAGRACPAPTVWQKGERVLTGNGQAEGSRPLPTMWKVRGWLWESARAGHARPLRGWWKGERVLVKWAVGEVTGHYCVCCRIRSKISLRILCKSRILLL